MRLRPGVRRGLLREEQAKTLRQQERLSQAGLVTVRSLVGNYVTSLETVGASLTVTLLDEELKSLWDFPVTTAALRW